MEQSKPPRNLQLLGNLRNLRKSPQSPPRPNPPPTSVDAGGAGNRPPFILHACISPKFHFVVSDSCNRTTLCWVSDLAPQSALGAAQTPHMVHCDAMHLPL